MKKKVLMLITAACIGGAAICGMLLLGRTLALRHKDKVKTATTFIAVNEQMLPQTLSTINKGTGGSQGLLVTLLAGRGLPDCSCDITICAESDLDSFNRKLDGTQITMKLINQVQENKKLINFEVEKNHVLLANGLAEADREKALIFFPQVKEQAYLITREQFDREFCSWEQACSLDIENNESSEELNQGCSENEIIDEETITDFWKIILTVVNENNVSKDGCRMVCCPSGDDFAVMLGNLCDYLDKNKEAEKYMSQIVESLAVFSPECSSVFNQLVTDRQSFRQKISSYANGIAVYKPAWETVCDADGVARAVGFSFTGNGVPVEVRFTNSEDGKALSANIGKLIMKMTVEGTAGGVNSALGIPYGRVILEAYNEGDQQIPTAEMVTEIGDDGVSDEHIVKFNGGSSYGNITMNVKVTHSSTAVSETGTEPVDMTESAEEDVEDLVDIYRTGLWETLRLLFA